ncbi:MAG TPA: hypothetical protein K8V51_00845 [Campylobacter avium]|uniref:hypothetical protein n=3 Tax=Campylobacter avium TaxID=522485 RepID=UPI001D7B2C38|nr:hypothetical protein [Campylobacter avium]HJE65595.1 hypothetical protein [Campylobacter avium]
MVKEFLRKVLNLKRNKDIFDSYRNFLNACHEGEKYTFIVGTNDSIGVQQSKDIKRMIDREYDVEGKSNKIYTYDIFPNYEYFICLDPGMFSNKIFGIELSLCLDTNTAGLFSEFIETGGKHKSKIVECVSSSSNISLNILFYLLENIKDPDKQSISLRAKDIFDNLCKFNSLDRKSLDNKVLLYNQNYYKEMRDYLLYHFDDKIFAKYNFIYSYLVFAFLERNSANFELEKSFLYILKIMQENGTNYSELLEFIYNYFKNGNNGFFRAVKTGSFDEVRLKIHNMTWDIFFYYSMRYNFTECMEDAKFGYPIFATMDKHFTDNYKSLFSNKAIVIANNTVEYCVRDYSRNGLDIMDICGNIKDDFQRYKIIDDKEGYQLSLELKEQSEKLLKKFMS